MPDDAKAYYSLGHAYGKLGKDQEVIDAYKKAIKIEPDYIVAHYNLALAYRKSGKYQEAVAAYKQVIRIKPNDDNAHYDLGMTYLLLDNSDSALDQYNLLKDLNKDLANKLFNDIEFHSKQK